MTATYTWVPGADNEPEPKSVIVAITADVNATGKTVAPGVVNYADADCGLTGAGIKTFKTSYPGPFPGNILAFAGSGGTQHEVKGTGSVTATTTFSGSTSGQLNVSFSSTATPVRIVLTGTTLDAAENHHALIGQKISATLSGGTFTNYNWTVPGEKFDGYSLSTTSYPTSPYSVVFTAFNSAKLNTSNPGWNWYKQPGTVTIICSADFMTSSGVKQVTAEKVVEVHVPTYSQPRINTSSLVSIGEFINTTGGLSLYAGGPTSPPGTPGRKWTPPGMICSSRMGLPAPFTINGIWGFAQLITPRRVEVKSNGDRYQRPNYGNEGLDNSFPYKFVLQPETPPWATVIGAANTADLRQMEDSPGTGVYNSFSQILIENETFKIYLMFLPPGAGSQWVPLHQVGWKWNANANRGSQNWSSLQGTLMAPNTGSVTENGGASFPEHPLWSRVITSGSL